MPKPEDYKHIRAWGKSLGSYEYYIQNQQEKAARENAPINAIYCQQGKFWVTADEIVSNELRANINQAAL